MLKDDKKESEVRYKNPTEYAKYINRTYDCMKENAYRIEISERLYYRATKDKKIEQWLEDHSFTTARETKPKKECATTKKSPWPGSSMEYGEKTENHGK